MPYRLVCSEEEGLKKWDKNIYQLVTLSAVGENDESVLTLYFPDKMCSVGIVGTSV